LPIRTDMTHDLFALVKEQFPTDDDDELFPSALPAVGAAFQAVGEGVGGINLLPQDKRAKRQKRLAPLTLGLAGLAIVLGLVWALAAVIQERRAVRFLEQQITALEPTVRQVQKIEEDAARLQKQLQVLDASIGKRVTPTLKNLSELLPLEFYLNSFRYKDGDLELSGLGSKPASDLVSLLENSSCLRGVAPKAPFTKTAQGETFTLGAQVEQCD
jgi:Tfp pilus assembly protein PilN